MRLLELHTARYLAMDVLTSGEVVPVRCSEAPPSSHSPTDWRPPGVSCRGRTALGIRPNYRTPTGTRSAEPAWRRSPGS